MKNLICLILFTLSLISCGGDDDICLSGESTPRLKLKFKTQATGKIRTLDSLYVDVDYGTGKTSNIISSANVDSVFVPLRVDDNSYTEVYFRLTKNGNQSKIKFNYQNNAIYVSPACGFKKNYQDLQASILQSNPVVDIEQNHNALTDEGKINFYLLF